MAYTDFTADPATMRTITARDGSGGGYSSAPDYNYSGFMPPVPYTVTVRTGAVHGSDVELTQTGPTNSGGSGSPNDLQGIISTTGNRIVINNTAGAETIEINHHSGAHILIDADGTPFIISSSRRGFGINASRGDGHIAVQNHLIVKGNAKITVETEGDLEFNVGKNLTFNVGGDVITRIKGSVEESIEGSKVFEVVGDISETFASSRRTTIAGDDWKQVSGKYDLDIGKTMTTRVTDSISIQGSNAVTVSAKNALQIGSEAAAITVIGQTNVNLNSRGTFLINSETAMTINTKAALDIRSAAAVKISGASATYVTSGVTTVQASQLALNPGGVSPDSPGDPANSIVVEAPQTVPANTIVDVLTTARENPTFPVNARRIAASDLSVFRNEGGSVPTNIRAATDGNSGGGLQVNPTNGDIIPPNIQTPQRVAQQCSYPAPGSIFNSSERLSRNITVGMFPGIDRIPESVAGLSRRQVVDNIRNLCFNILDPLWERYGGRISFTTFGGYRPDSANHTRGLAADIRASNRNDFALTAEIAAWVRDNLPYSKILLEKNNYGGIHLHVESAQPGQTASGQVLTCADPMCQNSTPGIQLSYAVAALRGRQT